MNKLFYKKENGSISIFTMISMIFLLFLILGIYNISNKNLQSEISSTSIVQNLYYTENVNYVYNSKLIKNDIPIYAKEQLFCVGKNVKLKIDDKIYDFSSEDYNSYKLMNNIVINIDELKNIKDIKSFMEGFENNKINTNETKKLYYYKNKYYFPIKLVLDGEEYKINDGTENIAVYGENFEDISNDLSNLSEKYLTFGISL